MDASLRIKGIFAISILIGYLALIGVFLAHQRQNLLLIVQEIEATQSTQSALAPLLNSLTHSIVQTQAVLNSIEIARHAAVDYGDLPEHFAAIGSGLQNAQQIFPALAPDVEVYQRAAQTMHDLPSGPHLAQMRDSQQQVALKLHDVLTGLQTRSTELGQRYHDTQQYVSVFAISANVVGAVASVAVILVFFTRLAKDIKRLKDRAVAIVAGYSGAPLVNSRHDEVGGLIDAVNRMQVDLRRHEQQLEIARQQRFHQEKMAAVGSLAAAIGHEVSNPIAAISGVAQFIVDETRSDDRPSGRTVNEFAAQILKQTERITLIMRQMATLTAPRSPEAELLDLNVLIQSTCGFIKYDKRLRGIEFDLELRNDIPAVTAVADHITQVLMNLLLNAADAMDHITEPGERRIRIETRAGDDAVHISVQDNGRGMPPEVLEKAFDESFTTKPAGKGRGIGLFVCKTLIERAGGRIALASAPDKGTAAKLALPLCLPAKAPA